MMIVICVHIVVFGSTGLAILAYKFINPPTTSLALYRKYKNGFENRPVEFIPIKDIPVKLHNYPNEAGGL